MNLSVAEVLKKAGSFKDVAERVQYLKKNETKALKAVIYFTYAKEIITKNSRGPKFFIFLFISIIFLQSLIYLIYFRKNQ